MPFDGPDGYAAGLEALARAFAPRRPLPISAWSQKYRRLSGSFASEPGPWRNERIPYLRAVMDALSPRHPAPLVVLCKSSQVGGSELALNWIGCTVHQSPGSFLALFPSEKVARKWVRVRLDAMIATTPELRALIPLGRRTSGGNTLQEKHGPGFVIFTGSANIPDDVASISVPYILFDEVDRMPSLLDEEGDPIELALRRSTTFPRSKALMISTPTTAENSRIWPAYQSSTMDRYYVPCVHCGHMQHLQFENLHWIDGKPKTAMYRCSSCEALIEERNKTDMLAAGEWRATHPEREAEVKGFHVNGLYTPIGLGDTWAKHAAKWDAAQGRPGRVQAFYNTRRGECHTGDRQHVEWKAVWERREAYKLRTIPRGVFILTAGVDVQGDRLEVQILGWGRGEQCTVIDYLVIPGDTTRLEPAIAGGEPTAWQKLDAYLAQEIVNESGVAMRLSCTMIDSGYLAETVMKFTSTRSSRNIFACHGSTVANRRPIGKPTLVDVWATGQADKYGCERYQLGVSELKHWLFEQLRADAGKPDAPVLPAARHLHFSAELGEDYAKQLCAETFDPKKGWLEKANYHRNEALDTYNYARAAAMHHAVAVHRMRESDWQRLEKMLETAAAKAPEPEFGNDPIPTLGGFLPTRARVHNDLN